MPSTKLAQKLGISPKSFGLILDALTKFPQIKKVVVFGSRAKGNYKTGSDIDLAVFGEKVDFSLTLELLAIFNERLPIPYKVDVINYNGIDNPNLKEHIDKFGILIL